MKNTTEAKQALEAFLKKALVKKKERYLGFISKSKTQTKFLKTIYHELEYNLDESKKVSEFDENILAMPGYKFEPPDNFGEPVEALRKVCDSSEESFLVVSANGKFAIHGPEDYIDSRAFYAV